MDSSMARAIAESRADVAAEEQVNGERCVKIFCRAPGDVETPPAKPAESILWIAMDKDCTLIRKQVFDGGGRLTGQYDAEGVQQLRGGGWTVKASRQKQYRATGEEGVVESESVSTMKLFDLDYVPKPADFQIPIPLGTRVQDTVLNTDYVYDNSEAMAPLDVSLAALDAGVTETNASGGAGEAGQGSQSGPNDIPPLVGTAGTSVPQQGGSPVKQRWGSTLGLTSAAIVLVFLGLYLYRHYRPRRQS
jgi:hypothetical protein